MEAWGAWFGALGESVVDGGNPFGQAKTITGDGAVSDGGNCSGYSIIAADSLDDAVAKAMAIEAETAAAEAAATAEALFADEDLGAITIGKTWPFEVRRHLDRDLTDDEDDALDGARSLRRDGEMLRDRLDRRRDFVCPECERDHHGWAPRRAYGRTGRYCPVCRYSMTHWKQSEARNARRAEARADIVCQTCTEPFEPSRSDARYCSSACRQFAYRVRRRAAASSP